MNGFLKYQHVERWNHQECEGLLDGVCHIFYKLDGTNASLWVERDWQDAMRLKAGSRNRELTIEGMDGGWKSEDNAGFRDWALEQHNIRSFFLHNPHLRLFGEWLVPHSLKTYRDDAWKRFYAFDVYDHQKESLLSYEAYKPLCEEFGLDYIPPMCIIKNPTEEDLHRLLPNTGQFLVKDGMGMGEGFVIKNYDYVNKYGRQTWGKVVSNEFKVLNHLEMGAPLIHGSSLVEEDIVEYFCTEEFIKKEQAKIVNSHRMGGALYHEVDWEPRMIPELLGRVWYEFLREETAEWVKKYKNPKVNFRLLQNLVTKKIKTVIGVI